METLVDTCKFGQTSIGMIQIVICCPFVTGIKKRLGIQVYKLKAVDATQFLH